MIVYVIERTRLYIGLEIMSIWKTREGAEMEVKVLENYYEGKKEMARKGIFLEIKEMGVKE